MNVLHPAAKMLVELSRAQDVEAGDGTTSVVVAAGALLEAAERLLHIGIHPTAISDAFQRCSAKAVEILTGMSRPIELTDRDILIKSASTSLNSKVVSQQSSTLAPLAVDAVLKVTEAGHENRVDLKNIKVIRSLGGTIEDTELVEGLVFTQRSAGTNGPKRLEKAKIGLIQFCISPPKTDVSFYRTVVNIFILILSSRRWIIMLSFRITLQWIEYLRKNVPTSSILSNRSRRPDVTFYWFKNPSYVTLSPTLLFTFWIKSKSWSSRTSNVKTLNSFAKH